MTEEQMLRHTSQESGEPDMEIVSAYLSQAAQEILNRAYPFLSDRELSAMPVPQRYRAKQIEIAVYLLNKRGAEGQTVHNENGISRSYESGGVPDSMLRGVVPYCGGFGG